MILEKLKNYEIPNYIKKRFWLDHGRNLKKEEIDFIFDYLKEFLYLSYKYKGLYLSSYIVDEAWHTFILFTKEYHDFCYSIFGEFRHHKPSLSGYELDKKEIEETYFIFKKEFNTNIFELDQLLNIKGSKSKGIITIKENKNKIDIFLNNKKI